MAPSRPRPWTCNPGRRPPGEIPCRAWPPTVVSVIWTGRPPPPWPCATNWCHPTPTLCCAIHGRPPHRPTACPRCGRFRISLPPGGAGWGRWPRLGESSPRAFHRPRCCRIAICRSCPAPGQRKRPPVAACPSGQPGPRRPGSCLASPIHWSFISPRPRAPSPLTWRTRPSAWPIPSSPCLPWRRLSPLVSQRNWRRRSQPSWPKARRKAR